MFQLIKQESRSHEWWQRELKSSRRADLQVKPRDFLSKYIVKSKFSRPLREPRDRQ